MTGALTEVHYDWAGRFCNMPALTTAAAPGGAPASAPALDTKNMQIVEAKRLQQLDRAVPAGLGAMIDRAVSAAGDIYGVAALAKVDPAKPRDAIAALGKGGAHLPEQDRINLQNALHAMNAQGDVLKQSFIDFKATAGELLQAQTDGAARPLTGTAEALQYDEERDDLEHLHDGVVQGLKCILDIASSPAAMLLVGTASGALELAGTDLLKDTTKGGNTSELLGSLAAAVTDIETRTDRLVKQLNNTDKEREKRLAQTAQQLYKLIASEQQHYVSACSTFNTLAKQAAAKLAAAQKGQPDNPAAKAVVQLYQAINDAHEACQIVDDRIAGTVLVTDLSYWSSVLSPLGSLVFDGSDSGKAGEISGNIQVYQQGGGQVAFYLPGGGLKNPLATLAAAVTKAQDYGKVDSAGIAKMCEDWRSAFAGI